MIDIVWFAFIIGVLCGISFGIAIEKRVHAESLNFTMSRQQQYETGMLPLCYNITKALNNIISESCSMMYGGPVVPN